jgi:hypothetical protein
MPQLHARKEVASNEASFQSRPRGPGPFETARVARFILDTEVAERPARGLRRVLDQFRA